MAGFEGSDIIIVEDEWEKEKKKTRGIHTKRER